MATAFRQDYIDLLKHYYFVGGMPEAVLAFSENRDFNEAREIQRRILAPYEQDFSKHPPNEAVPRIRMLWDSIPSQLTRENRKFLYGLIKDGARAKEYEAALLWLTDCEPVHKVHRVTAPNLQSKSLKAFAEKYHAGLSVRTSMTDYKRQNRLLNLPLYAIGHIASCV